MTRVSRGQQLFRKEVTFLRGVTRMEDLPPSTVNEVAFVGRSNVGKSSLLNALTKRKSLARTSKTPGCTRQLNFFTVNETLRIVDLPGYGYAKAAKTEVKGWNQLIKDYLQGRPNLRQVCVLVDGRHGFKPPDIEIMKLLDVQAVSYQVVFTKRDKVKQADIKQREEALEALQTEHPALHPEGFFVSSHSGEGMDAIRNRLAEFAE